MPTTDADFSFHRSASNASDWQRNATKPNDPILGQFIGFPLSNFIVQVIGMLVASTSEVVYGKVVWNPVVYLERLLVDNFDAAHRAGAFFISAGFVYSLLFSVSSSQGNPRRRSAHVPSAPAVRL